MNHVPVRSIPARALVFASFVPAALAAAVAMGDPWTAIALVPLAAGHWYSWRRREEPAGRNLPGLIAMTIVAAYFVVGWEAGNMLLPLTAARLVLAAAVVTAPFLGTRRQLYLALLLSLVLLYWASWVAFGWWFAPVALSWIVCALGFRHQVQVEEARSRAAAPTRGALLFAAAGIAGGAIAFAAVGVPITPSLGPVFLDPPLYPTAQRSVDLAPLQLSAAQPAGVAPILDVKTSADAYLRTQVYDAYRSGAWTRAHAEPDTSGVVRHMGIEGPKLGTFTQEVTVLATRPAALAMSQPAEQVYFPRYPMTGDRYGDLYASGVVAPGTHYSAVGYLPDWSASQLEQAATEPDQTDAAYLDHAGLPAAGATLATQAAGGRTGRYATTLAVVGSLKRGFRLVGAPAGGGDPLSGFFSSKAGDSTDFASAATLMLRSLGIPARLATGYVPGAFDPRLGEAVVGAGDWHAWVEVYFPGHGWVPFDASPGYADLPAPSLDGRLSLEAVGAVVPEMCSVPLLSAFQACAAPKLPVTQTPTPVVTRTASPAVTTVTSPVPSPRTSARPATSSTPAASPAASPPPTTPPVPATVQRPSPSASALAALPPPPALQELGVVFLVASLAILLAALLFLLFAARRKKSEGDVVKLYANVQGRLPRRREANETPLEYAKAMSAAPLSGPLHRLTELLNQQVFGKTSVDAAEVLELEREMTPRRKR